MRMITVPAALLLLALPVAAETVTTGKIRGSVVSDGLHVPGVRVTLTAARQKRTVVTDLAGMYEFDGLVIGRSYRLRAELPGLRPVNKRVELIGEVVERDLVMQSTEQAELDYVKVDAPHEAMTFTFATANAGRPPLGP